MCICICKWCCNCISHLKSTQATGSDEPPQPRSRRRASPSRIYRPHRYCAHRLSLADSGSRSCGSQSSPVRGSERIVVDLVQCDGPRDVFSVFCIMCDGPGGRPTPGSEGGGRGGALPARQAHRLQGGAAHLLVQGRLPQALSRLEAPGAVVKSFRWVMTGGLRGRSFI